VDVLPADLEAADAGTVVAPLVVVAAVTADALAGAALNPAELLDVGGDAVRFTDSRCHAKNAERPGASRASRDIP
jgi:hypothetical protein